MGEPFLELVVLNPDAPKPHYVVSKVNGLQIFVINMTISIVIETAVNYHEPNIWKSGYHL